MLDSKRVYLKDVGGACACGVIHGDIKREAVIGCERCDVLDAHAPAHFRCEHGAHCTRDNCW